MTAHIAQSATPFQAGAVVFDVADPDRHGKLIGSGPEVSEVRFDDGVERNIPNEHLRNVEGAKVELDNPVSPHDRLAFIIEKGKGAWRRLREHASWQDWKMVGAALVVGRADAMRDGHVNKPRGRSYNAAFNAWLKKFGFQDMDSGDRARLFQVMDHLAEIEAWLEKLGKEKPKERLHLNNPSSVLRKWKAATAVPDPNAPAKVSPYQKVSESVAALQEENDRMKRAIKRGGGNLWTPEDKPEDIVRFLLADLSKWKAEQVGRGLLKAVKASAAS
jgi:hypothetical protein